MSRDIKFRAWVNNHWTDFIPVAKTLGIYNESIIDVGGYTYEKTKPFIAEQYTGLKDKNGKEIYEGDIVRYADDYEENAEVVFDDGGFQVEWPINIERLEGDITCMMEVIGNIHENPELLVSNK